MSPTDADPFRSTEPFYAQYRPDYGEAAVEYVADRFGLDDGSRVLDLGCGTGRLAVPLAAHAGEVVGMDPNPVMLREASERAAAAGREGIEWVQGSDADLHERLGPLTLTTIGRAFHWMDRERTLATLLEMTEDGGGVALLGDEEWLTRGSEPWQVAAYQVAAAVLDDLPERRTGEIEYDQPYDDMLAESGLRDVETSTFEVDREWATHAVVGYVLSLSFASAATFGDRRDAFEGRLRDRLADLGGEPFVQHATVEVVSGRT